MPTIEDVLGEELKKNYCRAKRTNADRYAGSWLLPIHGVGYHGAKTIDSFEVVYREDLGNCFIIGYDIYADRWEVKKYKMNLSGLREVSAVKRRFMEPSDAVEYIEKTLIHA